MKNLDYIHSINSLGKTLQNDSIKQLEYTGKINSSLKAMKGVIEDE
mgnify:CR=1 FL=1